MHLDDNAALHIYQGIKDARWVVSASQGRGQTMTNGFEDIQKYGKENVDVALKSVDAVSKGFQALAAEATDYSKQSFSEGGAALEKMLAATSLDQAVQVQSGYL